MTYIKSQYDPFTTVGFDRIFNRIDKLQQAATNKSVTYPPYNITKESDTTYVVELAVAGFSEEDINVEVTDSVLTVSGNIDSVDKNEYIHKGIAARAFERTFTLADTVIVKDATLKNGMLRIMLENVIPEEKKPQKIAINTFSDSKKVLLSE
jgi:molecular chaperone IbpA